MFLSLPARAQGVSLFFATLVVIQCLCLPSASILAAPQAVNAGTPAEMLQQAIYHEETSGDLQTAKEIYRKVVQSGRESAGLAAEAQFRLGKCLLKEGKADEAKAEFQAVIDDFAAQSQWVRRAKEQVGASETIQFGTAPYASGLRETMLMELPGGQVVGLIGLGADKVVQDGKPMWRMFARRMVGVLSNEGSSEMDIDAENYRPLKTKFLHTLLGDSSATWTDDKLNVQIRNGAGETKNEAIELEETAYCNDQWFLCFRQLPLKIGYKQTLPLRIAFTGGNAIGLEVSVDKKETVKTPVGEFDCFRLDTNIGQTFWIADVPERYMTKFDGGGVVATLVQVRNDGAAEALNHSELGLKVQLPAGWFSMELPKSGEDSPIGFALISTKLASTVVRIRSKESMSQKAQKSIEAWAEILLKKAAGGLKDFEATGEIADAKLAGHPGKTVSATFQVGPYRMKRTSTLAFVGDKSIEVHHSAIEDESSDLQPQFDEIDSSIEL